MDTLTDEQRSRRRPIFNETLRAAASWLFFRDARSAVSIQNGRFARALKQPTDLRFSICRPELMPSHFYFFPFFP
jgi:hypothetical protein